MTRRLTILALCASLLVGIAGVASASPRSQGGIRLAGIQLAQSERYRPRGGYNRPSDNRRRYNRRRGNDDRYRRRYRRSPGTLNYGNGRRAGILPMGRVVPNVRRAVGGQVLRGGLRGSRYWFRVLTRDGRVVDVYADARTGRIVSIRGAR